MRLFLKVIFIYILLLTVSISLQSCCTSSHRIIGNGEVVAYDFEYNNINESDTISKEFNLEWALEFEMISDTRSFGIIQTAYATQKCDENYINNIIDSTISIVFDKDFTYDSVLVIAGTNILDVNDIDIELNVFYSHIGFSFGTKFINSAIFDNSLYEFKLKAKSNDNLEFANAIELVMNIN